MRAKRILLVEDDPLSLKLMREVLRASGYETEDSLDGEDALARASQLAVDLIVMDIGLPGLNDMQVTQGLRSHPANRAIPIIAVTAYAMPGDEARIRGAGCDAYLTKPLRLAELVIMVRDLLAEAERSDG